MLISLFPNRKLLLLNSHVFIKYLICSKEGEAEVIELEAIESSILIGVPLREKPLPDGVAIGAVIRDKSVILPTGSTTIEVGDRVIVFAKHDFITEIEKIFSVGIGFY